MQQIHNATSHNVYHLKIYCQVAKQLIPASVKPARAVIMIVSGREIIIIMMLPDLQDTIAEESSRWLWKEESILLGGEVSTALYS